MAAPTQLRAALFADARAAHRLQAELIEHCERNGWHPTAVSSSIPDLVMLLSTKAVEVVVAAVYRPDLASAVRLAGGHLEVVRPRATYRPPVTLATAVQVLVDAGRIDEAEAARLIQGPAGHEPPPRQSPNGRPPSYRHPKRLR